MSSENPSFSTENRLRYEENKELQARLSSILEAPLTVENINTFANDALNQLVVFTEDVIQRYKKKIESNKTIREFEDEAYIYYSLPNIGELLDRAQRKIDQIKSIEVFINERLKFTNNVITPPDTLESVPTSGEETFEKKKLIPRLTTLLYILETDFSISRDQVNLIQGQVTEEMMRQTPYFRVEIKPLNRVVYVCEEEGNASYIFDVRKLEEQGLALDRLDIMTKQERSDLIKEFPDIGRRIIQTKYWRENISELLSSSVESTRTVEEREQNTMEQDFDFPKSSSSEFDPWKGFWTDENEKHWASFTAIARKIGIAKQGLFKVIKDFSTKTILAGMNRRCEAYCYEEVLQMDYIKDFIEKIPKSELSGEWRGFYTEINGKHLAPLSVLSAKLGVHVSVIQRGISEKNISGIEMRDLSNRRTKAYCYEELASLEIVKQFIELPKVISEGEWKGFWIDENGKHWANVHNLVTKFNFRENTLNKFITRNKVVCRSLRDLTGRVDNCYCYENLLMLEEVKGYLSFPQVEKSGEWAGYYVDKNSNHWTTEKVLCKKFNLPKSAISKYLEDVTERLIVRNLNNSRVEVFCIEALKNDFRFQNLLRDFFEGKFVFKTGEWKDFYIDESGKHYGSERAIGEKVKQSRTVIKRIIDELKLTPINIKASNGIERDGYCYEDIASYNNPDSLLKYRARHKL
ncbi:MAG: hypothetical protein WCW03_01700 [Candidatus Paceibacterota bacterium]|jgi:hypothetical protein